jgi:hypothetical protein
MEYLKNFYHQSVSTCVSPTVARQRLDNNVTATTNAIETMEELLDALFFTLTMSRKRRVGGWFFTELRALNKFF